MVLWIGVPEQVSDIHVRRAGVGVLPFEDGGELGVVDEDVGGIEVAVGERGLFVDLYEAGVFVGEDLD